MEALSYFDPTFSSENKSSTWEFVISSVDNDLLSTIFSMILIPAYLFKFPYNNFDHKTYLWQHLVQLNLLQHNQVYWFLLQFSSFLQLLHDTQLRVSLFGQGNVNIFHETSSFWQINVALSLPRIRRTKWIWELFLLFFRISLIFRLPICKKWYAQT